MPDDFRIAIPTGDLLDNRIPGIFRKIPAVGTVSQALHRRIPCRCIEKHQCRLARLAKTAGVIPVHHSTSTEHWPHFVGHELIPKLVPMHHIAAHSMSPVHVAPAPSIRIMLKKQVIFAVEINHPVRVVIPATFGREVKLAAQSLVIKIIRAFDFSSLVHLGKGLRVFRQFIHLNLDGFTIPRRNIHRGPPVRRPVGQLHIVSDIEFTINQHLHDSPWGACFNRNIQILLGDREFANGIDQHPWRFFIRLHNLIHIDMAPRACGFVDNLNHTGLA